ncbi:MAG: hypothetical protein EZS28_014173 [Streblomastix strix]|uniref:Uncharacterized protein n=1 Tax=Streblomastix strix TaxID=222440 RepID=A0A5J4W5U1_9EUKA|nr:MAG: hypothetical protein EZS28_014173 [Streblomastix strix]
MILPKESVFNPRKAKEKGNQCPVFSSEYSSFVIKAQSFVELPLRFTPPHPGMFNHTILLQSDPQQFIPQPQNVQFSIPVHLAGEGVV